jgi:hypothetical protein
MLRIKEKLTILDDNNSVFTNYSTEALDYDRDTFTITLDSTTSYLYVGFYKPINTFYAEIDTANTNAGLLTGEYYNGSSWSSLTNMFDETKSLVRSGFIQWDRNLTDETITTIDSIELFWYRFRPSVTHSATVLKGINTVFSDDTDLKREFFEIADLLPSGETSHILSHVASREQIIQAIRQGGLYKYNSATRKDITAFDIHDVGQIKLASTYLTLSKIFGAVTDDPDDTYKDKSKEYRAQYGLAVKTPYIDIDTDDDGIRDAGETKQVRTTRIFRE